MCSASLIKSWVRCGEVWFGKVGSGLVRQAPVWLGLVW